MCVCVLIPELRQRECGDSHVLGKYAPHRPPDSATLQAELHYLLHRITRPAASTVWADAEMVG